MTDDADHAPEPPNLAERPTALIDEIALPLVPSPNWSRVVLAFIAVGTVVIPMLVADWRADPFVLPKLIALWVLLAMCSVTAAAGVLLARQGGLRIQVRPWLDVALAIFVALNVVATLRSVDPGQSAIGEGGQYQGLLTTLLYVAFFFVARVCVTSSRRLVALFAAVSTGSVLVALYAIAQELGVDPVWGDEIVSDRAFSSIGQPNALASYLVIGIAITVFLAERMRGLWRWLAAAAVAAEFAAVILTQSRGGYLALIAVAFFMAALSARGPSPMPWRALVAAAAVVAALVVALPPLQSRASEAGGRLSTIQELQSDESIRIHWDLWKVGTYIVGDNPLLGTGPETFPDVFPSASREALPAHRVAYFDAFRVESPHNLFLAIAAGTGVFALAAFGWFALAVAKTTLGTGSREAGRVTASHAFLAAAMAYAVTNFFITADLSSSWLMWLLAGGAIGSRGN